MKDDWWDYFIEYDAMNGVYIAWDETEENELGRFLYYHEAEEAILEHAKTIDKKDDTETCVTKDMPFTINVGSNEKITLNKKETKMDFQVGDKIIDIVNGKGTIVEAKDNLTYGVDVLFENGDSDLYTKDGKRIFSDIIPSLYHEGTEIIIKPAEPKRYPWVNIYYNGLSVETGITHSTKERALEKKRPGGYWKLVDTIQIKPKGEEK